jgi:hypothetical protein
MIRMYNFKASFTGLSNKTDEELEIMQQQMEDCISKKGYAADVDILTNQIKLSDMRWDFSDSHQVQLLYEDLKITITAEELQKIIDNYKTRWNVKEALGIDGRPRWKKIIDKILRR